MADSLLTDLPDLVVLLRRDGTIISCAGGSGLGRLALSDAIGRRIEELWPPDVADCVRALVRKAIANRTHAEAKFRDDGREFEVRISAQGPERALCVVRPKLVVAPEDSLDLTGERPRSQLDRRGFLTRFKESVSIAALREHPLAVALIHIEGLLDIGHAISPDMAERLLSVAVMRLPAAVPGASWYLGQLGETLLALVIHSADRTVVEECVTALCASLRAPVVIGDTEFFLSPFAGVAILGQDSSSPRWLLDQARASATEARRANSTRPRFFTDTLQVRSLARLDIASELREAIAAGGIGLRYEGRHDLVSGRLVCREGAPCWIHPLRGEIDPAEFLKVAESTGLAVTLSQATFACLARDFAAHAKDGDADTRLSLAPLRHHVLHQEFVADVLRFLDTGAVPPERLELRIIESAFVARAPADFDALAERGVRLVVDDVGRGMTSLEGLSRARIWGLRPTREDAVSTRAFRAVVGLARALDIMPLASGIDCAETCVTLRTLGCREGSGEFFRQGSVQAAPRKRRGDLTR